ncbi:MAG: winged helix-turn-helix domain-containing protein [Thermoplasmatota archaeon]
MEETVSLVDLRRHVVASQRFTDRTSPARASEVARAVSQLSCAQLDSIATVDRSHRIVLGARVGTLPRGVETKLLSRGKLFEYWAHEASLVPIEDWPLFSRRMRERVVHHWYGPLIANDPKLARAIVRRVRDEGPLRSSDFDGERIGESGWWGHKPAKRMLDALWTAGKLVISGRENFQRLYDLPERVVPSRLLDAPVPSEREFLRGLIARAVEARGALTERGVMEHYRLQGGAARIRPHIDALIEEKRLRRYAVEDGGAPVLLPARARPARALLSELPVLLSPFDNLLWDRAFVARVFGFSHVIEVFKRAHEREFGYYVLPLLVGDTLVGRADLKSDREAGVLRCRALHMERGVRARDVRPAFRDALQRLAAHVGLDV